MNPLRLFAQKLTAGTGADQVNIPTTNSNDLLANSLSAAYMVLGIVAVIVIIVAGFSFVTNGSDPAAVAKARNTILYAVVGLIVITSAFVITQFVTGRF